MPSTKNSAGQTVAAVPIREVAGTTATDEMGRAVASQPVRYVNQMAATDEMGHAIDAIPVVTAAGTTTTDDLGRLIPVMPVRVVAGAITTDEAGRTVPVRPAYVVGGNPTPTPAPSFTTSPSISPSSGQTGDTFTANDGIATNVTSYSRRWLLSGTAIGTGVTVTPVSAGSLVLEVTATGPGGSTVANSGAVTVSTPTPAPVSAVAADGWQATMVAPADLVFSPITVSRQGYDATGTATTHTDTLVTTKRVRQPYPNQASMTAASVALSDYVLSTDTIAGVTNNSGEASPLPVTNWAMLSQQLIGNSLVLEVVGNHWHARGGKPLACVEFTVTDGTATVTAKATALEVSPDHTLDRFKVLVYRAVIDVSSLATGVVTANYKAYPWIGGVASVHDSSAVSTPRLGSPRYFYKDTARLANPPKVYVSSAGNDAIGVVSTDASTARATPCLTHNGALAALVAATGVTGGYIDGCEIYYMDAVAIGSTPVSARTQRCAAVVVKPDPLATPGAPALTMNANIRSRIGQGTITAPRSEAALHFKGAVKVVRSGGFTFQGESGSQLNVMFSDGATLDCGAATTSVFVNNSHLYFDGADIINASGGNIFNPSANGELRMMRGVAVTRNFQAFDTTLVLGCLFTNPGQLVSGTTKSTSGTIVLYNRFNSPPAAVALLDLSGSLDVDGYVFGQNVVEITHTTSSTPGTRLSSDSAAINLRNVMFDNVTITGYGGLGRQNHCYDEGATARSHKFVRDRGTIYVNLFTKGDWFRGATEGGGDASARLGNWPYMHRVGSRGVWTQFVNPGVNSAGSPEGPAWAGVASTLGTSNTVRNDPLFVDYKGSGGSAGAGGGDYHLQSGSPCIGALTAADEVFPMDLDGNARNRGSLGAYR